MKEVYHETGDGKKISSLLKVFHTTTERLSKGNALALASDIILVPSPDDVLYMIKSSKDIKFSRPAKTLQILKVFTCDQFWAAFQEHLYRQIFQPVTFLQVLNEPLQIWLSVS